MAYFYDDFTHPETQYLRDRDGWELIGTETKEAWIDGAGTRSLDKLSIHTTVGQTAYKITTSLSEDRTIRIGWIPTRSLDFWAIRLVDINNFIGVRVQDLNGGQVEIYSRVSGAFTLLGGLTGIGNPPSTVTASVKNNLFTVLVDDDVKITATSSLFTGNSCGLVARSTWNNAYDFFEAYDGLGAEEPFRLRHNPRTNKVIPTLTSPTVTDIGATSARPQVTLTY